MASRFFDFPFPRENGRVKPNFTDAHDHLQKLLTMFTPCYITMVTALLLHKVFDKDVKSVLKEVKHFKPHATTNKMSVQFSFVLQYVLLSSDQS